MLCQHALGEDSFQKLFSPPPHGVMFVAPACSVACGCLDPVGWQCVNVERVMRLPHATPQDGTKPATLGHLGCAPEQQPLATVCTCCSYACWCHRVVCVGPPHTTGANHTLELLGQVPRVRWVASTVGQCAPKQQGVQSCHGCPGAVHSQATWGSNTSQAYCGCASQGRRGLASGSATAHGATALAQRGKPPLLVQQRGCRPMPEHTA